METPAEERSEETARRQNRERQKRFITRQSAENVTKRMRLEHENILRNLPKLETLYFAAIT